MIFTQRWPGRGFTGQVFALAAPLVYSLIMSSPLVAAPVVNAVPYAAKPLPLSAVRLTGGPLKRAQDVDGAYLLSLEPDRMMAFFRQRVGLQAKAAPYGGWDGD